MIVHHFNCGSINVAGQPYVTHVLLLELDSGLVLIDAGFGLATMRDPGPRIGPLRYMMRLKLDAALTALRQLEARGFDPSDVKHIVLTHADADHISGLEDLPHATVHLSSIEAEDVDAPATFMDKQRYPQTFWTHRPKIVRHPTGNDHWFGFANCTPLSGVAPGLLYVPLPGHTRGHVGVAIDTGSGWLLHAADAFFHHAQLDPNARTPLAVSMFERLMAHDRTQLARNHDALAALKRDHGQDVHIINAHDPALMPPS